MLLRCRVVTDSAQFYYLYLPRKTRAQAPLFVSVHGISRNARQHARLFAPLAERYGVVLVAPYFERVRFGDYQRLGRTGRGERADQMLDRILTEVGREVAVPTARIHLFGYSGGGQFAHRYAFAHPERVVSLAVGAAGWYTFPDPGSRYPHGVGTTTDLAGVHFHPERFLRVPARVYVGGADAVRDRALRTGARLDRQQGRTRLERGRAWVRAMRAAAHARGLATPYTFELLPGADHSFRRSVEHGDLAERVFQYFFGAPVQRE